MNHKPAADCPFDRLIKPRLLEVERPARYIGGEPGAHLKDWDATALHVALAFPDLYEIGMSYFGRELLYQELNARPDTLCERTFLPAPDMQELMRETGVALWALESKRPVASFDMLGVSLTHELSYPALLALLELAGLPLLSSERDGRHPLVIAGGQCMCNPEPVAPFLDLIVVGEGEEIVHALAAELLSSRGLPRTARVRRLAELPGCYAPALYRPRYAAGRQAGVEPLEPGLPKKVRRTWVRDFAALPPPVNPVQSYIELPGGQAYLEVMRGCPQGCRFCQAGYITRPARARPVDVLARAARELWRNTGAAEIGLMSLSTLDHPEAVRLVGAVKAALPPDAGVALPSLRADRMSAELAELARRPRETSLTVAIEAGSDELRRAIRKGVLSSDVLDTFDHLMAAGWHKFKLYFMCGFAGEPLEAMDHIAGLVRGIFALAKERGFRRPRLTLALSVLVPKAQTPLEWQAMEQPYLTRAKQRRLRELLRPLSGSVTFHWHEPERAVIEALLSRGGRSVADAVLAAYRRGQALADLDFSYETWCAALDEAGVSLEDEVFREREAEEGLPWDHIDCGVGRAYLRREWDAYGRGEGGPPCHEECTHCGIGCAGPLFR